MGRSATHTAAHAPTTQTFWAVPQRLFDGPSPADTKTTEPAPAPRYHTSLAALPAYPVVQRKEDCCSDEEPKIQRKIEESEERDEDQETQVQPRLEVGPANDAYEREADAIASYVMSKPVGDVSASGVQETMKIRNTGFDNEVSARSNGTNLDTHIGVSSNRLKVGGAPLPEKTREFFETKMGADFSKVRIHAGNLEANKLNKSIRARAFTYSNHIWLGNGESIKPSFTLAHEMAHVVQQGGAPQHLINKRQKQLLQKRSEIKIMKKGFESTVTVCHRVLKSRKFRVEKGGVRTVFSLKSLNKNIPNCRDFKFNVTLTKSIDWWPDKEIATCGAMTGGVRSFSFANVGPGTYYLTIWRLFDHPYCCLEGDIIVNDESISQNSSSCKVREYPSLMKMIHTALDVAGFVPALGAIPDALNAIIYAAEGDWTNAGISAVAMVPAFGDGAKLVYKGGKEVIEASGKSIVKMGQDTLSANLKNVKAASKKGVLKPAAPGLGEAMIKTEHKTGIASDIASQSHKHKTKYRAGSGKLVESAHMVPTVAVKKVHGYSRSKALTILFPKGTHRAFDKHWMDWARKRVKELRKQGLPERVTVEEWEMALNRAIQSVPELSGRTGDTMSFMIRTEFYQTLGLRPTNMLPLPRFK